MTLADSPTITPLLAARYRWATVGMVSLVFLAAFEALAVTTIMPSVSADLDGRAWFSAAFSATLAASVVGMVAGGLWSDRTGPRLPLLGSVAVFAAGLLLAGLAPGIELFVAARFLQGLGSGAMTVALYVVVARLYAPIDHPRIFGAFAAAWVIPSMVGPTVAGVVAEAAGWRWVFLGVVALSLA
ncbi:MAG TPA: MFS transporter, partial [Nocardioides sp.]|nr:MFS transporter [Nocardioides sp.]